MSTNNIVLLDQPEKQNLLGLIMKDMLASNLSAPSQSNRIKSLKGDILVQASSMTVTLRFEEGKLTIIRGKTKHPKAWVKGKMSVFLEIICGENLLHSLLSREISFGGNPFMLLKILPLIKQPS